MVGHLPHIPYDPLNLQGVIPQGRAKNIPFTLLSMVPK